MALGTTNITFAVVKALLADATDNYFLLCTSNKINKWSKYKPVRDAGIGADWPAGDVGKYGFNLPTNWNYLQPRGGEPGGVSTGIDEPARLADFRGYEHDSTLAYPSIQCRDTDNSWNANLYPSGTPYLQRWYCRAHRSASSVIVIPSDIGLDSYYVGLKVSAGAVWYKTFGQVSDLTFAKSWNISISTEITTWATTPAFANFPYHVGLVDWQLILCSNSVPSWAGTGAGTVIYFTGIEVGDPAATYDTDGTNTYITSGSFTIKDWLKVSDNALIHGIGGESEYVTVYCSYAGGPPDWTASKISGTGITLACYDGGTPVNCNLVQSGFKIQITTSALSDVSSVTCYKDASDSYDWLMVSESGDVDPKLEMDGLVRVTSNSITQDITVSQGYAGDTALTFTYKTDTDGADFPPTNGTIEYVVKRGATQVYPSSGWATATGQRAGVDNTVNIADIGETAQNTDYSVYIRLVLI